MQKNGFCVLNSVISVVLGGLIYVFFCKGTILNCMVGAEINAFCPEFVKIYIPDWLWCYSLCSALCIFTKEKYAFLISSSCGILWEAGQYFGIISGTGDWIDIILYITAGFSAAIIIKNKGKKTEEQK